MTGFYDRNSSFTWVNTMIFFFVSFPISVFNKNSKRIRKQRKSEPLTNRRQILLLVLTELK